jgi:hypothetical protein
MTDRRLRPLVVPLLIAYALAFVPFALVGRSDQLTRLQLAGSSSRAREIVGSWSSSDTVDLAFLQGFDFVHPLLYGVLLALGAVWARRHLRRGADRGYPLVAWIPVVAAGFDVLENIGMIAMIRGNFDAPVPTMTSVFAMAKYALLLLGLLYIAAGAMSRLRRPSGV